MNTDEFADLLKRFMGALRRCHQADNICYVSRPTSTAQSKTSSSLVAGQTGESDALVELLCRARGDKRVAGGLLRGNTPEGVALASDIV